MPAAGMWLSAINMPGLEHSFEGRHPMFLVELRTLRQVCRPAEVVECEQIAAALGASGYQLGADDLGEVLPLQEFAKILENGGLDTKYIAHRIASGGQRPIFEPRLGTHVCHGAA